MSFLLVLLSVQSADARGFSVADIPYTTTFSYTWTGVSSGSTTWSFDTAIADNTGSATRLCKDTDGCLDGTFSTGNGGTGTYSTEVTVNFPDDCTAVPGTFQTVGQRYRQTYDCDLFQSLSATYDTTGATYNGVAYCGETRATLTLNDPDGVTDSGDETIHSVQGSPTYTYAADPYSGVTSAFIGSTNYQGTFSEL